jgi:hypothetical protein
MTIKTKISDDLSVAYIQNRGVTIETGISAAMKKGPDAPAKKPKVSEDTDLDKSGNIAFWGESNTFPQDVVAGAEKDPFIYPLISRKTRMLYGRGVEVGIKDYDDNGKAIFLRGEMVKPLLDPVHAFHRTAGVNQYLIQTINDFYWFHNMFPQLIMNNGHNKIVNLHAPKAAECRWSVRKTNSLVSDKCFINSNWDGGANEENSIPIGVLDPFNFPHDTLKDTDSLKTFIFPMSFPDPIRHYYSLAPWNVYRTSKWSEFVQKIPAFKVAMMTNAMLLRWHVKINTDYWTWRFKEDWRKSETNPTLRKEQIDSVFAEIDTMITGTENAGKAIYTHVIRSPKTGDSVDMIQISRLDDNLKLGEISEDSAEASSFAIFSFELHPTLVGHAPGSAKSALGAGSGSDQRVAWNNYLDQCGLEIEMILNPLHFIRDFNGWDPRITWRFAHNISETLDVKKPSNEPQQTAS